MWQEHYKTLLTANRLQYKAKIEGIQRAALKQIKNGKFPGPGKIPIVGKCGPHAVIKLITDIFNDCLIRGKHIALDWKIFDISSTNKKGNRKERENCRGISVSSSMGTLRCTPR